MSNTSPKKPRILIASGIYPPMGGGPAQYAYNLNKTFKEEGCRVKVRSFGSVEYALPSGIRHLYYFLKIIPAMVWADFVLITDTYSAAVPAVILGQCLRKITIIRTGGDFLWEEYVERTGEKVLLRDFYQTKMQSLIFKERIVFYFVRYVLKHSSVLVFSTEWQKQIFYSPYGLATRTDIYVVENYYDRVKRPVSEEILVKGDSLARTKKIYSVVRSRIWKNIDVLEKAVAIAQQKVPEYELVRGPMLHGDAMKCMDDSYIVAQVSLGDISPNMILEAIRAGKPFILTKENGILNRVEKCAILVDPQNVDEIARALVELAKPDVYASQRGRVQEFSFVHTWSDIAHELIGLYENYLLK